MRPWPLFDLAVHGPAMTLRYTDDALAERLALLAARGVHDPGVMPFTTPWTDVPSPELERRWLQWQWGHRAAWRPDDWTCHLTAISEGEVIGGIHLHGHSFARMREVQTGSWLGRAHQGRGLGREMRRLALGLAFQGLEAEYALSDAYHDNAASLGVSRSLGYEETGRARALRRDDSDWVVFLRLTRDQWRSQGHDDIRIEGLEACGAMFGV